MKMVMNIRILGTLFKLGQFENAMKFKRCDFKPHLFKMGLNCKCIFDVVMHSNKQTGPLWYIHPEPVITRFSINLKFCDLENCAL